MIRRTVFSTSLALSTLASACHVDEPVSSTAEAFELQLRNLNYDASCQSVALGSTLSATCSLDGSPISCSLSPNGALNFSGRPGQTLEATIVAPNSTVAGQPAHVEVDVGPDMLTFATPPTVSASCRIGPAATQSFGISNVTCTCLSGSCQIIPSQGCGNAMCTSNAGRSRSRSDWGSYLQVSANAPGSNMAAVQLCTEATHAGWAPEPWEIELRVDRTSVHKMFGPGGRIEAGTCIPIGSVDVTGCNPAVARCHVHAIVELLHPEIGIPDETISVGPFDLDCL